MISPTTALLVAEGESEVRPAQNPDTPIVTPFAQSILFDNAARLYHIDI